MFLCRSTSLFGKFRKILDLNFCSVKVIGSVFGSVLVSTTSHGLDGCGGRQIVFFAFDRITVKRQEEIFETMIFDLSSSKMKPLTNRVFTMFIKLLVCPS